MGSPQVAVINKATTGDDSLAGISSVVIKDVLENTVVSGNTSSVLQSADDVITSHICA
jgi:serine acetyltransferase